MCVCEIDKSDSPQSVALSEIISKYILWPGPHSKRVHCIHKNIFMYNRRTFSIEKNIETKNVIMYMLKLNSIAIDLHNLDLIKSITI